MSPHRAPDGVEGLLRLSVSADPDVFLLRQRGREVAAGIGMDGQDQIRVASALSDLGRELVRRSEPATVLFGLRAEPAPALVIEFGWTGGQATGPGWDTVRRFMDSVEADAGGTRVTLVKDLSHGRRPPTAQEVDRLRRELSAAAGGDALDELRTQNQELLAAMEDAEAKGRELERLNSELEDTNRGVMALYKELSDELEQTNQGVVALYAELEEKTTQLREAAEARTRFWSTISHELRSPVNSVVGLTRLLAAPGSDPLTEEQRRQVTLVNQAGETLLALVNELLDTAKAESGSLRPRPAPVDLPLVVAQLRGALQTTARTPDVALVVDAPADLPVLVTDETMLVRILRNLLSNGLKFTERGEVRLTVRPDSTGPEAGLRFTVADTGIGIPAEEQPRVFEEFYQVANKLQAGVSGTGLGLPYARKLARILGGDLVLTSAPGVGTKVELRLPLGADDAQPVGTALVVDADGDNRALLTAALDGIANRVAVSADGRDALASARAEVPGLVLLSCDTPLVSGSEVLSVLRQDAVLRGVPVVVTCPDADSAVERTVSRLGAVVLPLAGLTGETVRRAVRDARAAVRALVASDSTARATLPPLGARSLPPGARTLPPGTPR
ncbi:ATP-binding protein [Actinosynnema pretiosum]|uniref:histidine kinase n=1 Tax=Actinosynnema pretiosum TaxID=42197 RepID=A0A290Z7T1_9PSEU|nr:ATP-binding protein [Actinosynnema pretiosum]ATE55068.1 histidine kinase [Actinosynnema pretiosum]